MVGYALLRKSNEQAVAMRRLFFREWFMLKVTKMVDYAVLVLSEMYQQPDRCVSVSQLSERFNLGSSVIAKICRLLTKAGILGAERGAHGGYLLALSPERVSLQKVADAIAGYVPLVSCEMSPTSCSCASRCHLKPAWQRVEQQLTAVLEDISMVDFLPVARQIPERLG